MSNESQPNFVSSDSTKEAADIAANENAGAAVVDSVSVPVEPKPSRSLHWKLEFLLLAIMLAVALTGMAVTQASVNGAWGYWLFAVIFFAGVGMFRDFKWARRAHAPVWASLAKQILHWAILLLVMKALFWMERYNAISRESSSLCAILLLATTSIHAGVHFHWTFAIVGVVLAIMSVVVGVLEQSMLLSSLIVLPLVLGGAFLIMLKLRKSAR